MSRLVERLIEKEIARLDRQISKLEREMDTSPVVELIAIRKEMASEISRNPTATVISKRLLTLEKRERACSKRLKSYDIMKLMKKQDPLNEQKWELESYLQTLKFRNDMTESKRVGLNDD